jgi:hypothetical protein
LLFPDSMKICTTAMLSEKGFTAICNEHGSRRRFSMNQETSEIWSKWCSWC